MNKIIYDTELEPIKRHEDIWSYYYKYTQKIKSYLDCIKLCLYCSENIFSYNTIYTQNNSLECILLSKKWLKNPNLVTLEEIRLLDEKCDDVWDAIINLDDNINTGFYGVINSGRVLISLIIYREEYLYRCAGNLFYISIIKNMDMYLIHQYLQILLRTTKQFNTQNPYSNYIKEIIKQDVDKLELVDYNMLLDISNEHYNIDLSEFCYDNIFSRRNLIELIRREYLDE